MTKNAEIEKSSIRRKPFKSEILQLTADELNYSLCLFVKEVRKPNGSEYAPDTIYYLVLGELFPPQQPNHTTELPVFMYLTPKSQVSCDKPERSYRLGLRHKDD